MHILFHMWNAYDQSLKLSELILIIYDLMVWMYHYISINTNWLLNTNIIQHCTSHGGMVVEHEYGQNLIH